MFRKDDLLLLGLSGGRDSVALLHVLLKLGHRVEVAHCNFKLRDEESELETDWVKKICKEWGVSCAVRFFETKEFAVKEQVSIQMAARTLRYNWFEELRQERKASYVLTAHHLDDQAESFLINFSRGTGLKGLLGIPKINKKVVRPMLAVSRSEIDLYVQNNELKFVEDSSNTDNKYLRNRFRNKLLPVIKQSNDSFYDSFKNTLNNLTLVDEYWEFKYKEWRNQFLINGGFLLPTTALLSIDHKSFVSYYLKSIGFSIEVIQSLFSATNEFQTGVVLYAADYQLLYDRGSWVLAKKNNSINKRFYLNKDELPIPITQRLFIKPDAFKIPHEKNIASIDASVINGDLHVRNWEQGDCFVPLGMKGKKKLSDFFIDEKINRIDKQKIWLLCDEKSIIWLIGWRIDDRYKISSNTKQILQIHV